MALRTNYIHQWCLIRGLICTIRVWYNNPYHTRMVIPYAYTCMVCTIRVWYKYAYGTEQQYTLIIGVLLPLTLRFKIVVPWHIMTVPTKASYFTSLNIVFAGFRCSNWKHYCRPKFRNHPVCQKSVTTQTRMLLPSSSDSMAAIYCDGCCTGLDSPIVSRG